jgi:hypothetical protein
VITAFSDLPRRSVRMNDIDFHDIRFKISKNRIPEKLLSSIHTWGVLEDPVVIPFGPRFIVLAGHNRLHVLRDIGIDETNCRIAYEFNIDAFLHAAELKFMHGELGPVGRIKLLLIACEHAPHRIEEMIQLVCCEFNVPEFISRDADVMKKAIELPRNLADYSDSRDIAFKTLKELVNLPEVAIEILSSWVDSINFRMNIFRDIVEILHDISKRDGSLDLVRDIHPSDLEDPRGRENHVLGVLKEIRYPEYTISKQRAESLVSALRGKGISVDLPKYFEGDTIGFVFRITKREGSGELKKNLEQLDMLVVQNLLDLL